MKLVVSKALFPYFNFYGNIHYISKVPEQSCSYSIRCNCLARQIPAPTDSNMIENGMQLKQAMSARVLGC
jgi:hypothetical protein